MPHFQKLLANSALCAWALGAAVIATAPAAEAGKISKALSKPVAAAAVGVATRGVARAARKNELETANNDTPENGNGTVPSAEATAPIDNAARAAAQAKAKLEAETAGELAVANSGADAIPAPECIAGCNPVPAGNVRTIQSLRDAMRAR